MGEIWYLQYLYDVEGGKSEKKKSRSKENILKYYCVFVLRKKILFSIVVKYF